MARRRAAIALTVFVALVLGVTGLATFGWRALHAPLAIPTEGATLDVASGTSLRRVTIGFRKK